MIQERLTQYIRLQIDLTNTEAEKVMQFVTPRKYTKGQYLVQQGDVCKFSAFILKGASKTSYIDLNGQEHIVVFSVENWWASDIGSFISQSPADYNVQFLEDSEVILFPKDQMENIFTAVPVMERFFRLIIEKSLVASQKRIVKKFSLTAKEQYVAFKTKYPKIEQRIPQYMIASYLGITKEFLSKIKSQLLHDG